MIGDGETISAWALCGDNIYTIYMEFIRMLVNFGY